MKELDNSISKNRQNYSKEDCMKSDILGMTTDCFSTADSYGRKFKLNYFFTLSMIVQLFKTTGNYQQNQK